jgi:hypothetical protein
MLIEYKLNQTIVVMRGIVHVDTLGEVVESAVKLALPE